MSARRAVESVLLQLPFRLVLGGLFCVAAWAKLHDPQSFAEAIKGFRVLSEHDHAFLITAAAFMIPWVEMVAGVALILGLWTRAAALALGLALIGFVVGLVSVIARGIDGDCSCFGDMKLICDSKVGWCQVIRNLVLLLPAGYLVIRGGGLVAIDALLERPARSEADPLDDPADRA
ncbi:MAG: DoxX family membrane protein [Phycisphaerales bacterium]|nr:DoxX family membrane protein [Planctomycetota bacterium]MCH8509165.1 DoxX family membrane protein [Phycisphaerales bacterium]